MLTGKELRNLAAVLSNIDKDELECAAVINTGQVGGSDWKRFNDDPLTFIIKLPDERRERLCEIINEKL